MGNESSMNTGAITLRSASRVIFSVIASIALMAAFSGAFAYLGFTRAGSDREAVLWFCLGLFACASGAILFVFHGTPLGMVLDAGEIRVRRFLAPNIGINPADIRRVKIERYIMRARNMRIPRLRLVIEGEGKIMWSVTQDQLKEAGTAPEALSSLLRSTYASYGITFTGPDNQQ